MITIELDGKEYDMPDGWHEINIEKFEKLVKHFSILSEYKSQYQYAIELFSILMDAPVEEMSKITKGSFEILATKIEWTKQDIPPTGRRNFIIDGEEYMAVRNLDALEMGDVVSLELQINNSQNWELLTNMLPILVRKAKKVQKSDGTYKTIPGDFNADEYEETKELFRKHLLIADVNELRSFF